MKRLNPKSEIPPSARLAKGGRSTKQFRNSKFEFVSDFDIRYSDLTSLTLRFLAITILLFLFLGVDSNAYGADIVKDIESFEYDTANIRDPFIPLVSKDGKIAFGYGAIRSIEDIKLEGIVYDSGGDSIAIINGMVLKENDTIGNIKLIKIEPDKVSLLFNQEEHIISLEE